MVSLSWWRTASTSSKSITGTLLGTPNREPQEYSRNIIGIYLPASLYSIPFLLYFGGSLSGVPKRTLLGHPLLVFLEEAVLLSGPCLGVAPKNGISLCSNAT